MSPLFSRILVTGGAGFIGSHTVELLLEQGYQVTVLDNLSTGQLLNLNLRHPNLEFIEGDILEFPLLKDLIAESDAVLHLAAIASVPLSIEDPIYSFQVNVQGFIHVLEAIRQAQRPIRLVYASSAAVYGDDVALPCRDDIALTGTVLSPYALHKREDEWHAALYASLHGVSSLGLRYFNVYGERQNPNSSYSGVISRFIEHYKQNQPLTILGDGKQSRDFIAVTDIARANGLALQSTFNGVLNIATGHAETLLNLVQYIESAGGYDVKRNFAPARAGDIKASYAAVKAAATQLGFEAAMTLPQGIAALVKQTMVTK